MPHYGFGRASALQMECCGHRLPGSPCREITRPVAQELRRSLPIGAHKGGSVPGTEVATESADRERTHRKMGPGSAVQLLPQNRRHRQIIDIGALNCRTWYANARISACTDHTFTRIIGVAPQTYMPGRTEGRSLRGRRRYYRTPCNHDRSRSASTNLRRILTKMPLSGQDGGSCSSNIGDTS